MARKTYTPEQKAEVCAALAGGMSVREAAKHFGMPSGTVATLNAGAKSVVIVQENKQVIGAKAYGYITETLDTLHAQVKHFGSSNFLSDPEQTANAQGLAILHGVIADKLIRFFEAYGDGNDSDPV